MDKTRSHYDNLKVARNAPIEVIRAAYRALSQQYHPDKNPGNPKAAQIMTIINSAYDVLSDSEKRREHDTWLAQQENGGRQRGNSSSRAEQETHKTRPETEPPFKPRPRTTQQHTSQQSRKNKIAEYFSEAWKGYLVLAIIISFLWIVNTPSKPPQGPKPYQATPSQPTESSVVPTKPVYTRPTTAPNGKPWPTASGYIAGYSKLHTKGLSTVTVDNSSNNSDVFVKLVSLDGDKAYPVRTFFISGNYTFTLRNVTSGNYDIRYRDLNSGGLSRSESFYLKQNKTEDGTVFSNLTMTLYKVHDGNMKTFGLSEDEF